ncbi:GNAT family N-acetyltransferase [uncultured Roseobacter sp.]|uniref:GNAT family N-acetyltransferase n=1 Tax=uncultured Roseobacter sp. TaxID=114847 RepID=UPI0034304063
MALCYEDGNTIAGYVIAVVFDVAPGGISAPRRIAMLNEIAVREEFRGQGIADRLLTELVKLAKSEGATAL